jgi:hypothetical protein
MKKWLIFFIIAMCPAVWAQSYYLRVNLTDGTTESYSIADIQKVTFEGWNNIDPENAEKIRQIVETFRLFQNHPNPFNISTTLEYEIPKPGEVDIKIFNIAGQLVKRIMHEFQEAGHHTTIWDGKNDDGQLVTSGLYVYHIMFEDAILLKKMTLLK